MRIDNSVRLLNIMVICLSLIGCGFKGPLYMPPPSDKPVPKKVTASKPISSSPQVQPLVNESSNQEIKLPK